MSRTRQLSDLRNDVYVRCDTEGMTSYIPPSLVDEFINQALTRLYARIVRSGANWYLKGPTALTLTAGNSEATLPSDCMYVKGIDTYQSSEWVNAYPFNFEQRNDFQAASSWNGCARARVYYDVRRTTGTVGVGAQVAFFLPVPGAGDQARVWYYPSLARLAANADTFDGVNGWERYVVDEAAAEVAEKEESFQMAQSLRGKASALLNEIVPEASANILGHARQPVRSRRRRAQGWPR